MEKLNFNNTVCEVLAYQVKTDVRSLVFDNPYTASARKIFGITKYRNNKNGTKEKLSQLW